MDEEQSVSVGSWKREVHGDIRDIATVFVYQISTADAASHWIRGYGQGQVAEGWSVVPYDLSVQSFLSTFRDQTRYEIAFGKERFLVIVSGASTSDIDQVARCLLRQIENR